MSNFSARKIRVIAYKGDSIDPMDFSRAIVEGFNLKSSSLDTVGWCGYEAEILLWQHPEIEELDTRINPLRSARGNKITIEVMTSTGWVLVKTMRMLNGFYKQKDQTLRLQIGCKYTLKNSRRPPGDSSPATISGGNNLRKWVDDNLQSFGLPTLATGLGDRDISTIPINGSMPYQGGGNIMDHIGAGLWASSGLILCLDAQERSRLVYPDLMPTSAAYTGDARDCEPYERSDGEKERPPGRVRVLGNPQFITPYVDPLDITTVTTTGPITRTETISESHTANSRTVVTTGTETITGLSVNAGANTIGGPYKNTLIEYYGGGLPQQPNPDPDLPGTPASAPWITQEVETQEQTPEAPTSGSGGSFGLRVAKKNTTDYSYGPQIANPYSTPTISMVVGKIVKTTERDSNFEASTSGGSSTSVLLNTDIVETEEWDKVSESRYRYRKTVIDPIAEQSDRRSSTVSSSAGSSEPPATKFRPPLYDVKTIEVIGIARFDYPVGAPLNDYPLDKNLGQYIQSKPLAEARAKEVGGWQIGRHEGQDIGFVPTDGYLADWKPFQAAFIHRNSALDDVYLIDGATLMFEKDKTYIATEGIWAGVRDRTTGTITPPYQIPATTQSYLRTTSGYLLNATGGKIIIGG
jgi:hypothetical protein